MCKYEGEDKTLKSWQRKHKRFFVKEDKKLGYEFRDNMPVVFEYFDIVHKK